jgi:hypothetical protein
LPEQGENVMDILPRQPLTVADVRELRTSGPWPSKSGGGLRVPIALSEPETRRFFDYDAAELERIRVDIRGVRVFFVSRAPAGGLAGNQFHRLRTEIEFVIQGSVRWEFEDLYGGRRVVHASPACALYIPPFILHRVTFEEPETTLATLTNTVYVRDDPRTDDTYSAEAFQTLAERFRAYAGPR